MNKSLVLAAVIAAAALAACGKKEEMAAPVAAPAAAAVEAVKDAGAAAAAGAASAATGAASAAAGAVTDAAKRYYAGHLVNHRRNAAGLAALLNHYFKLPIRLTPFVGHWLDLPPSSRAYLGSRDSGAQLGVGAVIGKRVWDCQHKFRVEIGPLNLTDYRAFLPGGKALGRLITWIKNYVGDELAWDLKLVLNREDVPRMQLGGDTRLGWTTWLLRKSARHDATDLCLRPEREALHG